MGLASCGLDCEICQFKIDQKCSGCHAQKGKIFWGKCDLYECAYEKNLPHCGKCGEFPCEMLKEWSSSEGTERIDNLKKLEDTAI